MTSSPQPISTSIAPTSASSEGMEVWMSQSMRSSRYRLKLARV
jgi:hypothetical protein